MISTVATQKPAAPQLVSGIDITALDKSVRPQDDLRAIVEEAGKSGGTPEQRPRWKRAVQAIDGNLGEMLGKLYVERHFPALAKARMDQLVANLRLAYKDGIDLLDWMSPETKAEAQKKLAAFTPLANVPEF